MKGAGNFWTPASVSRPTEVSWERVEWRDWAQYSCREGGRQGEETSLHRERVAEVGGYRRLPLVCGAQTESWRWR